MKIKEKQMDRNAVIQQLKQGKKEIEYYPIAINENMNQKQTLTKPLKNNLQGGKKDTSTQQALTGINTVVF